jgi:hypothetical protein
MTPILIILGCIVWTYVHSYRAFLRAQSQPQMLFTEPRQCVQGFKRLANARHKAAYEQWRALTLPALTEEDRL